MSGTAGSLRAGDIVRIRNERWRIVSHIPYGESSVLEAAGCDAANRSNRSRFLLPFEPIDRLPSWAAPRLVRPGRWRRFARRVLAGATPSWGSLRAAARSDLVLIPFQLEPALALIHGDGCRFLIADEVGLGKTVQAGLMMAEVLERRPDARVLVIAPAALREQWRHELRTRFHLDAEVLDAAGTARIAADLPAGINPWSVRQIIVTSIDYIKRPEVMRSVEALSWDFAAFDEAHNLAGRSDRAAAAQIVAKRSRTVALLTATPHSGDDKAFHRLCSIGDVQGGYPLLMFRRTREDAGLARKRRTALLRVRPTPAELAMHAALVDYARKAWAESATLRTGESASGARLAMTVLARRACSSAGSLARSVERRLALLQQPPDSAQLPLPLADASAEDEEPGAWLGSRGLNDQAEEQARLKEVLELARRASANESKLAFLRRFMRRTPEPAIVFTEYRDTLERIADALAGIEAVQLHGGLAPRDRVDGLSRFAAGGARLLLATDAASEGLNLHHRCRLVINLELPWTPIRLDQRAGRVDRIGQSRTVHAIRLVAAGTSEELVLARLARRLDRMRDALVATPDERMVAESVLGAAPIPALPPATAAPGIIHVDRRQQAREEAGRLERAKAWLATGDDHAESRPLIVRFHRRRSSRRTCLWAFRLSVASASDAVVWETILAAGVRLAAAPERSARATRAILQDDAALRRAIGDAQALQVDRLRDTVRQPLELWIRRELDLMSVMREAHARMSAELLQGRLFDRRNERAAAAQDSTLADALSQCRIRLDELRACESVRAERCDLTFAVMLE